MKKNNKKKKEKASVAGNEEVMPKRPRGKTTLKIEEKRDSTSFALKETLQVMMTPREVRGKSRRKEKEDQIKIYLNLQMKKFVIEEAAKRRKFHIKEAVQARKLAIEAIIANIKAKEIHG
ncbi:Receptor-like protein kinase HSL1 [Hordeum vulgare]|nr:Receptor-like protein kinase HSL1 [Hordeum vulgare]